MVCGLYSNAIIITLSSGGKESTKSNNFWVWGITFWGIVTFTKNGKIINRVSRI